MAHRNPDADVYYHTFGGSQISIIPNSEEAYRRLIDADVGMDDSGRDHQRHFPSIECNYPTSTNRQWAEERYNKIMDALSDLKMENLHPQQEPPYPVGSRLVYP